MATYSPLDVRYGVDPTVVTLRLQSTFPITDGEEGLDCVVTLLRHIFSFRKDRDRHHPDHALVKYAWLHFETSPSNHRYRYNNHEEAMEQLLSDAEARNVPHTFLGLSHDARDILWGDKAWAAYYAVRDLKTNEFHRDTSAAIAENSMLRLDCTNNAELTAQDVVDDFYTRYESETGSLECRIPPDQSACDFMRIEYTSHPTKPHTIRDLRAFRVTFFLGPLASVFANAVMVLIAVVRLRSDPGEADCIRTYSGTGEPVVTWNSPPNREWSVGDLGGHQYLLVYRRMLGNRGQVALGASEYGPNAAINDGFNGPAELYEPIAQGGWRFDDKDESVAKDKHHS